MKTSDTTTTIRTGLPNPVWLDPRTNGPRGRSNGGFVAGMLAELAGGTATVRLLESVPLDAPLTVRRSRYDRYTLSDGRRALATAVGVNPFTEVPPVIPTMDEALAARDAHPFHGVRHLLSDCVVCGPDRADGLHVTPGPLDSDPSVLATPFVPHERDTISGVVTPSTVWGALDCPSYPAAALLRGRLCLLGSITAHRHRDIELGEELIVVGWTRSEGNRSRHTSSALIDGDGRVVASARAVWVELRHQILAKLIARWS
ncbi:hypothetical protein [Aeromicrobium sp.]|uniref:hypothetical protein n=1 Tax=Aeromicrobium sp. TaxID=1871063 RepID=UPI002FCB4D41